MNTTEAARFINGMALRPGWSVTAEPYGPGTVAVRFTLATYNSNEMFAPDYRADPFTRPVEHELRITPDMHRATIAAEIVRLMLETEAHEHSEFTRYQDETGRWVAPLHPHRPEGRKNWMTGRALPRLLHCLTA